ncbi:hypothetical protein EOE67_19660 [Rheinheimera riviphila]|uniref:DUF4097 domain-containing protein n=1 Tax=Rheinheimera riviphila TaxID=1834037 RepID=A0A437QBH8_9GAMM|nr:DUF4097 family beta strand repeat-containing protein [Rheinheimera riviphila]RVU31900.1 hypothetical protein EOE67_19660 [Rheinheimera riviphila]
MKNLVIVTSLCCLMSFPLLASEKELTQQFESNELSQLQINTGVGDITVEVTDASQITVDVTVRGSKSWLFGRTDVSDASLESDIKNGVLSLEVPLDDTEQTWVVKVPRQLAVDLQLGVGSINMAGNAGDISADIGVGSFAAKLAVPEFKNIELSAGVGDVSLQTVQGKTARSHLVGAELEYAGPGEHAMAVTVGVGDATVKNTSL